MSAFYLIKIGEIQLKDGNRNLFLDQLKRDIKRRLSGIHSELSNREGRFYLSVPLEHSRLAEFVLSSTPGVNGWAPALKVNKDMESITKAVLETVSKIDTNTRNTFKVESRRSDKGFPMNSYELSSYMGGQILDKYENLSVDVHNPKFTIHVEIREKAYIYSDAGGGVRGLPVGTGGRGLLMLSGGIDSPVAGFRMLCRGLALESLYFHAYPYTSKEAWQKVADLAGVLACFGGHMSMHTAHFTDVQMKIKKDAPMEKTTLYLRACMVIASDMLAKKRGLNSLVTGESLGQVASQTAENIRFTSSFTDLPILRPLIGTDKEATVDEARRIGSYDISILPYEDCCVLFSPKHPILKAKFEEEREAFCKLGFNDIVGEAVDKIETIEVPFKFKG